MMWTNYSENWCSYFGKLLAISTKTKHMPSNSTPRDMSNKDKNICPPTDLYK